MGSFFMFSLQTGNKMPKHTMRNKFTLIKKATSCSEFKTKLVFFFEVIVYYKFLKQGQTVHQHVYLKVSRIYFKKKKINTGLTRGFTTMTILLHIMH